MTIAAAAGSLADMHARFAQSGPVAPDPYLRKAEGSMPMNRPATLAAMGGAGVAGAAIIGGLGLAAKMPMKSALGAAAAVGLGSAVAMFPVGIALSDPDASTSKRIAGTAALATAFGAIAGLGGGIALMGTKFAGLKSMAGIGLGVAAATTAAGLITHAITKQD